MGKDIHLPDYTENKAHTGSSNKEQGACLWGHDGDYRPDWSCSYRWQAHDFSKGDADRKKIHNNPVLAFYKTMPATLSTSGWSTGGGFFPAYYAATIKTPREPEDWYLDGPKKKGYKPFGGYEVPIGENFKRAYWPYWHNSHHLIPKGTLIAKMEDEETAQVSAHAMRLALLKAKYNVNHYHNMLILPQDARVGYWLDLPRHLILKEGNPLDPGGLQVETMNHQAYNDKVAMDLSKALRAFINNVKQNIPCKPQSEDRDFLKDDLKELQKECFKQVIEFGVTNPGEPISAVDWEDVFA